MFQKITLILLLLTIISCKNSDSNESKNEKIKATSWLLGNWENNAADGNLKENWQKVNDSTFKAQSYYIKKKDTIHFETITLQQKGELLIYTATVKGQNEDKPIAFKLTTTTENQVVFENPKHDYPQKINYKLADATTLIAKISGKQAGKVTSETYTLKKMK